MTICIVLVIACCTALSSLAPGQSQPPSPPPIRSIPKAGDKPKPTKSPIKRVHVDLAGFELDKAAPHVSSTQIGGGTRQMGTDTILLAPRLTRLYTSHPFFQWTHSAQAQHFIFHLVDADGMPVYSAHVSGREFHYPDNAPALKPGAEYGWNVQPEAALLGGISATCRFVRLSQPEIDEISKALERIDQGAGDSTGNASAGQKAQLFTERRLWFEAVHAYTKLIKEYPDDPILRDKRGMIYDQLPETREWALEDFAVAEQIRSASVP